MQNKWNWSLGNNLNSSLSPLMEEHQETSFYTQKSREAWRFLDDDLKSALDGYLDEEHRGVARVFELYRIWSHADVGSNFRALLTKLDVDSMSWARIISDLKCVIGEKKPEIPSVFGASLDSLMWRRKIKMDG